MDDELDEIRESLRLLQATVLKQSSQIEVLYEATGAIIASHPDRDRLFRWLSALFQGGTDLQIASALPDTVLAQRTHHRRMLSAYLAAPQYPTEQPNWQPARPSPDASP